MLPSLSLNPVLACHDIERIHEHSLDLLERVGIDYKTPKALEVLEKLGCPVDYDHRGLFELEQSAGCP